MTPSERRREIINLLLTEGYVEAKELSDRLGVDISTVRRDLDALARTNQVQRTHGGARPVPGAPMELPYAMKQGEHLAAKRAIARAAAARVQDGDTVVLDSGSTTYEIALALTHHRGLTVITNDLRICKFIAQNPNMRLLVTGGELLNSVYTLVGEHSVGFFDDFTADTTFLGADAVDPVAGITNTNTLEVPVKRAMIAASRTTLVVADSTKFGRRTLARVAAVGEVAGFITDTSLPEGDEVGYGELTRAAPE
ncbi:DeoR/GlpR family DNA-binding transcription regulator [Gordonia hydrophobica]|uniref:Lactose phosphotransferase system repressor n=1 Tax=Gordonia hydrophobica TaxID=40516 RepID=A0ABZ2U6C2_9ACTN|nr:DeoR/GlpR family DNA-binding transcription regulator [Gordonia hydrophobica]MBM7368038.1 DeoR family transcriptional regulator of aga operon [Gordonia hydrophobica]